MIGPMRNLDIQNLLEAFETSRETFSAIKQGPHSLGNGRLEFQVAGLSKHSTSLTDVV